MLTWNHRAEAVQYQFDITEAFRNVSLEHMVLAAFLENTIPVSCQFVTHFISKGTPSALTT